MIRLRRDFTGFAAGRWGSEPVMTLLGLWTLIRSFPDKVVAGLVLAGILLASAALMNASSVALTPTELLAGSRFRPKRWNRELVTGARSGKVRWGRGGFVQGVELVLSDGTTTPLPSSAFLRDPRHDRWLVAINEWASGNDPGASKPD